MIYLIVGYSGSGKTSVREYLEGKGFTGFEASTYIKRAMHNCNATSVKDLLEKESKDIAARIIQEDLVKSGIEECDAIISGFRTPEEIKYFTHRYPVQVIGLHSRPSLCFARVKQGKRQSRCEDPATFEEFQKEKIRNDNTLGLDKVLESCVDKLVINEGKLHELYSKIDAIMKEQ